MRGAVLGPGLVVAGVICLAIAGALIVGAFAYVVVSMLRRRRPSAERREEALRAIGYRSTGQNRVRDVYGTVLTFDDRAGWRWTVRLPRYNTLTLRVEERSSGVALDGAFSAGQPQLDERFVLSSIRAAQTVALVRNRGVIEAMLAVPNLSLELQADELVIADRELRGLAALAGSTEVGTAKTVPVEVQIHQAVVSLVVAIFDSMYSKQTGTIMPEHR